MLDSQVRIGEVPLLQKGSVASGCPVAGIELLVKDLIRAPGLRVKGRPPMVNLDDGGSTGTIIQLGEPLVLGSSQAADDVSRTAVMPGKIEAGELGLVKIMVGRPAGTNQQAHDN